MRLIRLAMLVGLIAAIPICALIYQGVSRLERGVQLSGEMREALRDTAELMNPVLVESGFDADADSEPEPAVPYPLTRSIANHAGQSLEVVVTGRDGEALHFLSLLLTANHSLEHIPSTAVVSVLSLKTNIDVIPQADFGAEVIPGRPASCS